jgi:hypothetical protein
MLERLARRMPAFLAAIGDRWRDYDGTCIGLIDGSGASVWETSSGRISEAPSACVRTSLRVDLSAAEWVKENIGATANPPVISDGSTVGHFNS